MSEFEIGLVTWDSVEFNNKPNRNRDREDFVRLQSGNNVLRLVTRPYQYNFHKWKADAKSNGYGEKIKCAKGKDDDKRCPLCELGDKAKRRWFVGVIDRKTQSYKILDMSPAVFQAIQKLTRNEKWGDPGNYDIDIIVDKNAGATGYYTVMPEPKEPLSDSDIDIRKNRANTDTLMALCQALTYEKVEEKMQKARDKAGVSHVAPSINSASESFESSFSDDSGDSDDSDDSDDTFDFPPANLS